MGDRPSSSGMVTRFLTSFAAIPGYSVSTVTRGSENSGSLFIGKVKREKIAAIVIAARIMITVTGRRTKSIISPLISPLFN